MMNNNVKETQNTQSFLPKGMTLFEYLKSPEGKERIRKAREEYQRKHPKGK